jgi:hypothetical protein
MAAFDSFDEVLLYSTYSEMHSMHPCFLVIGGRNMDSGRSHYSVTEGGVT